MRFADKVHYVSRDMPAMEALGASDFENRHSSIVQGCWEPKRNIAI
jgi:hypothetical protein